MVGGGAALALGDTLDVKFLWVERPYRCLRTIRAVLDLFMNRARESGIKHLVFEVPSDRKLRFWLRMGAQYAIRKAEVWWEIS